MNYDSSQAGSYLLCKTCEEVIGYRGFFCQQDDKNMHNRLSGEHVFLSGFRNLSHFFELEKFSFLAKSILIMERVDLLVSISLSRPGGLAEQLKKHLVVTAGS